MFIYQIMEGYISIITIIIVALTVFIPFMESHMRRKENFLCKKTNSQHYNSHSVIVLGVEFCLLNHEPEVL